MRLQSAYCESFDSKRGFKARFVSHLNQNEASKRVLRVIWFRTGIQSAFRESFDSKRGFKARFASHLIQNGASKRVSRIIWFRTGLFKARFASHLVQNGDSKRVSRIIWFKTGFRCWIKWLTKRTLKPRFESNDSRNALWSPVLGFLQSPIFRAHQKIVELVLFTLIIMKVLQK